MNALAATFSKKNDALPQILKHELTTIKQENQHLLKKYV